MDILAAQKVIWESILYTFYLLVSFTTLMQYNVDDFVMLTYIFGWLWHEFVDDLAE